jgi:hypothetical protein
MSKDVLGKCIQGGYITDCPDIWFCLRVDSSPELELLSHQGKASWSPHFGTGTRAEWYPYMLQKLWRRLWYSCSYHLTSIGRQSKISAIFLNLVGHKRINDDILRRFKYFLFFWARRKHAFTMCPTGKLRRSMPYAAWLPVDHWQGLDQRCR